MTLTTPATPQIKAIFFDLDGTLFSSIDEITDIFITCLREQGVEPDNREAIRRYFTLPFSEIKRQLAAIVDVERFLESYDKHERRLNDGQPLALVTDALVTLTTLQERGISIGVVSNKLRRGIIDSLDAHGLVGIFDVIVGRDDVTTEKPDPEPILHACSILDISPHEILFVGDSLVDLTAAREAGSTFVGVLTGACTRDDFETAKADYIAAHVGEVLHILDRVNA